MWTTLKDARVEVPSLHQVKNFKLPDFVPPIRVRCYITISVATHYCYAGSVSFKYTILCCRFHQSFLTALEAARYLIFFFVIQCKQIDIRKFSYCVVQALPVVHVFSTEVRYFMGGSGTLIADLHLQWLYLIMEWESFYETVFISIIQNWDFPRG